MEIDIRDYNKNDPITCIRVASECEGYLVASGIAQYTTGAIIADIDSLLDDRLLIKDLQHAKDLIAGIEKAIELGWFK